VQLTVTQPGQCAFVVQEQNTQIGLWQKLVVLKQFCLQDLMTQSLPIGKHPTWKMYSQQTEVSQDGVMWYLRMHIRPK